MCAIPGRRLQLESQLPEDTLDDLADHSGGNYTGILARYRDAKTGTN